MIVGLSPWNAKAWLQKETPHLSKQEKEQKQNQDQDQQQEQDQDQEQEQEQGLGVQSIENSL